ncbi:MAG: leucine-rich repeat protein, partial [Bacteroidaceae bacterium]|nr:leucine-rich repeat protein [Bacteroidaceae bacterium]
MARYNEYGYGIKDGVAFIPTSVTEVEEWAFYGCKQIRSIEFPQMLKKIGDCAFFGCSNLTDVSIPS